MVRGPVVDPDMVMLIDIEPAYLANKPVVWQRLRPMAQGF
jgi:hypothetical protein